MKDAADTRMREAALKIQAGLNAIKAVKAIALLKQKQVLSTVVFCSDVHYPKRVSVTHTLHTVFHFVFGGFLMHTLRLFPHFYSVLSPNTNNMNATFSVDSSKALFVYAMKYEYKFLIQIDISDFLHVLKECTYLLYD